MSLATPARRMSYRVRMLAMADRLFTEFDNLPVKTVLRAITSAHRDVREHNEGVPSPAQIEAVARDELRSGLKRAPLPRGRMSSATVASPRHSADQ